ncbi:MAG: HAD family hydrolase [Thermodesulfobacteriota bacterium]
MFETIQSNLKKAIFFDFGDTLASTNPPYLIRLALAFRDCGYHVSDDEFESAYLKTDYEVHKKYLERGTISPLEYREWFFPKLCKHLSLEGESRIIRERIRAALRGIDYTRSALPGAIELIELLKDRGLVLGVISNNDGTTQEKCEEVGIKNYFDIIADSTNLGFVKPDSRIFQFALEKLNISSSEALHIGDLYGSDVLGGRNAGLDVIWLNKRRIQRLDGTQILEVKSLSEIIAQLQA